MSTGKQGMYNMGSAARTMGMSGLWYRTALLHPVLQAALSSFAACRNKSECILCGCRSCFSNPLDSRKTRVAFGLRAGSRGRSTSLVALPSATPHRGVAPARCPCTPPGTPRPLIQHLLSFLPSAKSPLGTHSQQMPRKGHRPLTLFSPCGVGFPKGVFYP